MISGELKQLITDGDYQYIADIYKEKHELLEDYRTVTREYVRQVLNELKPANPGTAAEEIELIAKKYLQHKRDFREAILI